MFIRSALALVVGCIVMIIGSPAKADLRISCVARSFERPTLEQFKTRIVGRLSDDGELLREAQSTDVLDEVISTYYNHYHPKDIFCVVGDDVMLSEFQEHLITDGGNVYLFAPESFEAAVLTSGEIIEGLSVTHAMAQAASDARWHQGSGCAGPQLSFPGFGQSVVAGPDDNAPAFDDDAYAKCIQEHVIQHRARKERLFSEADTFALELPGEVLTHTYSSAILDNSESDIAGEFLAEVLAREVLLEGAYQSGVSSTEIVLSRGFTLNSDPLSSVSQWTAQVSEEILRTATNEVAMAVLRELSNGQINEGSSPELNNVVSVYRDFLRSGGSAIEAEFSDFLCLTNYANILSLSGAQRFWFNLASFEEMLCGRNGPNGGAVFYSPPSLLIDPNDIRAAWEIGSVEQLALRLERKLDQLAEIQLDQSQLLNEIRRVVETDAIDEKINALRVALQAAEEAARAPSVLEQVGTLGQLGTDVGKFIGAVGNLVGIWSGIPAASVGSQGEYLWGQRKNLSETGGQFSSSVAGIERNIAEIERWFDRTEQVEEVNRLKEAIAELEAAYQAVLEDVSERRASYRAQLDAISQEAQSIDAAILKVRHAFSANAADVVALNFLAHANVTGGSAPILQCQRAIELQTANGSETSLQNLVIGCLQISAQVQSRQSCIAGSATDNSNATFLENNQLVALIALGQHGSCF